MLVPRPYVNRIKPGDPRDPLLLQVLPREEETEPHALFTADPLAEAVASHGPGVLWKYRSRLLIVTTGDCGVHCRFCFRRHFPYSAGPKSSDQWDGLIHKVGSEPSIREIVLSGGDPLTLDDAQLATLTERSARIDHLHRLRIHTRLPVMVPERVTSDLIAALRGTRLTTLLAIHVNHPAEIDGEVAAALKRLADAGIPLLSQSVLLKGVNDDLGVLARLFEHLVDLRVMPYYLHQLDRVEGAAHFEVPEERGVELVRQLRARLPGYAVPRFVREWPGASHKTVLA